MVPPNVMLVSLVQPLNALLPIKVTSLCITTLVRLLQLLNTYSLMLVTFSGITILVKLSQLEKAFLPILDTLLGISTLESLGMKVEYYETNGADIDGACGQMISD